MTKGVLIKVWNVRRTKFPADCHTKICLSSKTLIECNFLQGKSGLNSAGQFVRPLS